MKLSKREKTLICTALVVVAIFGYHRFLFLPAIHTYIELRNEIEKKQKQLASILETESKLADLTKSIAEDKEKVERLEEAVPSSNNLPEIIVRLENLSVNTGVKLKGIHFGAPVEHNTVKEEAEGTEDQHGGCIEIPIAVRLAGTFSQVLSFLDGIETSKRIFSVKHIAVVREYDDAGAGVGVDMELSAYAAKHGGYKTEGSDAFEFMEEHCVMDDPFKPLVRH